MAELATDIIVLNQRDNVATARRTLKSGTAVAVGDSRIELRQTIPGGHKVALASIDAGKELLKYGQIIGFAKEDIEPGDWVHTHNVVLKSVGRDYGFCEEMAKLPTLERDKRHFSRLRPSRRRCWNTQLYRCSFERELLRIGCPLCGRSLPIQRFQKRFCQRRWRGCLYAQGRVQLRPESRPRVVAACHRGDGAPSEHRRLRVGRPWLRSEPNSRLGGEASSRPIAGR